MECDALRLRMGVGLILPKRLFNRILDFSVTDNAGCLQAEGID